MRTLKLNAEYFCHPLWELFPDGLDNVDPEKLSISSKLQNELKLWAEIFTRTFVDDDPNSSGFKSVENAKTFQKQGLELADQLQKELGPNYQLILGSNFENPLNLVAS